ncbi:hypothetical protein MPER_05600, partial [Moniliophthora perniciosa FA553]
VLRGKGKCGCTWLFELAGGAINEFDDSCIPKSNREAAFTVAALHQWDMGLDDYLCISTAEKWIRDTLKSVSTGGVFPSAALEKIGIGFCKVKQPYDPANVFRNSLWPLDEKGEKIADPNIREPPTEPWSWKLPFDGLGWKTKLKRDA